MLALFKLLTILIIFALICSHFYLSNKLGKLEDNLRNKLLNGIKELKWDLDKEYMHTKEQVKKNANVIEVMQAHQNKQLMEDIKDYVKFKKYKDFKINSFQSIDFFDLVDSWCYVDSNEKCEKIMQVVRTLSVSEVESKVKEYREICCNKSK